jgi:hypothetical protein
MEKPESTQGRGGTRSSVRVPQPAQSTPPASAPASAASAGMVAPHVAQAGCSGRSTSSASSRPSVMTVPELRSESPSTAVQNASLSVFCLPHAAHASRGTMALSGSGLPQWLHDVRSWTEMVRIREVRECVSALVR